jgi:hypothetical protein
MIKATFHYRYDGRGRSGSWSSEKIRAVRHLITVARGGDRAVLDHDERG